MSKFTSHITARRIGPYNNIKAKEQTGNELHKQLPLRKKCLELIAENALRSPETNSLIPTLLVCCRNIVCLVFIFRWRREILQWNYVPFMERACCNCHVMFCFTRGTSKVCWEYWKQHEGNAAFTLQIIMLFLVHISAPQLYALALPEDALQACTRRCKAGFCRAQWVLINWDCKCLQTLQNRGQKTGQTAQESLQWAGSCLEPTSAYG